MKKRIFLLGAGLALAALSLLAFPVFAKYRAGETRPLPLSVVIRKAEIPEGRDYVYDGLDHGIAFDDALLTAEGVTEESEAGTYVVTFSLKDPVTSCFTDGTREDKTVTLRIAKRPVLITSGDALKAWDGAPLTEGSYVVSPGRLPEGRFENVPEGAETLENAFADGEGVGSIRITGSQTDAGSSENLIGGAEIVRADGTDVTQNYDISYVYGRLTVEPVPIDLPEDAAYKWNGETREIGFGAIAEMLSVAEAAGVTVLDADGNDVTSTVTTGTYFDGTGTFRLFGTGAWNQKWSFRMSLKPDGNHYWSEPLHGEVTDLRTVTLEILPELGNARDIIIAASTRSMVDGFSASGLAGLLRAPIVAVTGGAPSISAEELSGIARLASPEGTRLWIMGGPGSVTPEVEAELNARIGDPELHITSVNRLTGLDRYDTAWHIFEAGHGSGKLTEAGWNESGTVIILPGTNVEPTLSIMTYAYAARIPVLLCKNGVLQRYRKDMDMDGTAEEIISAADMLRSAGFKNAILVGPSAGSSSTYISEACEEQLRLAVPDVRIMRIAGSTIGAVTNAICAFMESSSPADVGDSNVLTSGRYSYVAPEAVPRMTDSGRVVSIAEYADIFREIDVLGNAHLFVRTSAQFPYRYSLRLTNGEKDGEPVLMGWTADSSITEVLFGNANGSQLQSYTPDTPEGLRFIGFGAPWLSGHFSYAGGVLSMTLRDSYLSAITGSTRSAVLYALFVEEGKDASNRKNYLRYKGVSSGGSYSKILVDASDCRLAVPRE